MITTLYSQEGKYEGFMQSGNQLYIYQFPDEECVIRGYTMRLNNGHNRILSSRSLPNGDCAFGMFTLDAKYDGIIMEAKNNVLTFKRYYHD